MLLGTTLTKEIGHKMYRYVILIDPACNQFEVIAANKYERMVFTHGILELHKAYNLPDGAWITMISVKPRLFVFKRWKNVEAKISLITNTLLR